MSSQAERIKAFKLAQHARLQKQDEEEQWISSEELCTEGSSDEETHTSSSSSSKTSHRKQKRNPRTEKRGISPLAQPPRVTETESTSAYQRDSKYLLPDMYTSNFTEMQSTSGMYQLDKLKTDDLKSIDTKVDVFNSLAHPSKAGSSSLESEETDEDAEIEKMIQWRPKRGSIKLPDFPEGELGKASTLQHAIFEVDAFYMEMVAKINFLKRTPRKTKYKDNGSFDMESLIASLEKKKKDPNVCLLLEKISKLDTEISKKNDSFETVKKERLFAQEEMCNAINDTEVSVAHSKSSQIFLHLCSFEKADDEKNDKVENNANNKSSDQQAKKQKKNEKPDKNFVTRNIELAKARSMAQFSLTDEEKVKLESLLSDIDSEEYSMEYIHTESTPKLELKPIEKQTKKEIGKTDTCNTLEEDVDGHVNYFKLKREEMCTIEDLDIKLHEILKSYDEDGKIKQALVAKNDKEDMLQSADNEGRYWKHHQLQKRLENIEKDLANIAAKDAEEQEKFEKNNQQRMEESDKLEEEQNDKLEEEQNDKLEKEKYNYEQKE